MLRELRLQLLHSKGCIVLGQEHLLRLRSLLGYTGPFHDMLHHTQPFISTVSCHST